MEHALLGGAIPEIADRDPALPIQARRECGADCDRDRRADQRHAAQESDGRRIEVHRAAHAAGDSTGLAEDLRDQSEEVAAERQQV